MTVDIRFELLKCVDTTVDVLQTDSRYYLITVQGADLLQCGIHNFYLILNVLIHNLLHGMQNAALVKYFWAAHNSDLFNCKIPENSAPNAV